MPQASMIRSKQQAYKVCRLAKIMLDSSVALKLINSEISAGSTDFFLVDYTALGYSELEAQNLIDATVAGEIFLSSQLFDLTSLAAYGDQ